MLKLPKGLKKKKKGKKSKKNQELFTEEELEQYKREQREKNKQLNSEAQSAEVEEEYSAVGGGGATAGGGGPSTSNQSTSVLTTGQTSIAGTDLKKSNTEDDEWLKFKALTTGIDTVLKKTQGDLDRIKESSFFQRVPTKVEKELQLKQQQQQQQQQQQERAEAEEKRLQQDKTGDNRAEGVELTVQEKLAQAVVELSESEEESEEADDIFDTDYIDALTSGDVHLAYVPESPTEEELAGPDPFDTAYADKVIKGPEVSKRGKKIVNIGSAVEVLTGRVEKVSSASAIARRPRRGPQNLLLESFDEGSLGNTGTDTIHDHLNVTEPIKTLLDDITDELPDAPIDLSVSLHLAYQSQQQEVKEENTQSNNNILTEFDVLNDNNNDDDDDDEFAELAAESLNKKDEPINFVNSIQTLSTTEGEEGIITNWSAFEGEKAKSKPSRPPPPRPIGGPHVQQNQLNEKKTENEDFDDIKSIEEEDDPFDTTFVEQVVKKVEEDDDDDFDFDPRADENKSIEPSDTKVNDLKVHATDLLGGSNSDLTQIALEPIEPANLSSPDFDPFDTTAVNAIVQPKSIELNLLEKELLSDTKTTTIKHSLSDPDFDPRAEEIIQPNVEIEIKNNYELTARRKSSLSLNISGSNHSSNQKSVGFAVSDLLTSSGLGNTNNNNNHNSNKIQKPLTPYPEKFEEEKDCEDPFDTSFVPTIKPTDVELNILEKDLLTETKLKHSISDPDFDPRAEPSADFTKTDLLGVDDQHNIKVLTPAGTSNSIIGGDHTAYNSNYLSDPFDTSSIDHNILPGKAELKLIENELLPVVQEKEKHHQSLSSFDTNTDSQELGLGDKVLTPQIPFNTSISIEEQDPFDTSFASNLAPGKTEIKLLESELIGK